MEEFWDSLKSKKLGFGEITRFDTTDYKVKLAAEVKDFSPENYMDFKAAKRMELFCQYGVAAAKEAFSQAGLDMENKIRTGWDVPLALEWEACRQQKQPVIRFRRKVPPE